MAKLLLLPEVYGKVVLSFRGEKMVEEEKSKTPNEEVKPEEQKLVTTDSLNKQVVKPKSGLATENSLSKVAKKSQPRSIYSVGETRSGGRLNLNRQLKERQNSQKTGAVPASTRSPKLRSKITKGGAPTLLPPDFEDKLIKLARVVKVVKGGRRFSFSAYVVAGNRKGKIGLGHGKANEVQDAIKKATKAAFKNAVEVPIVNTSVPHESFTKFLATKILIKPAAIGRGLVAAGVARIIVELAGYVNITTKVYGARTAQNVAAGMIKALTSMRTLKQLQTLRYGHQPKAQRRF